MPETFVDKTLDNYNKLDARQNAVDEEQRNQIIEIEQKRTHQERLEKARLRGKHALEKEILNEVIIIVKIFESLLYPIGAVLL
jgi:hypothetical protein